MEHTLSELYAKCKESDMILVGIGEEFQYDWDILIQNKRFQEIEKELEEHKEYNWVVPFIQKMYLDQSPDIRLDKAYKSLQELLKDRNYFILSVADDDYIYRYDFKKERIVTLCGGFSQMQCDGNCSGKLYEVDEKIYADVKDYFAKRTELEKLREPQCEKCGEHIRFNQFGVKKFAKECYLPAWELYTKWLQGTLNKKLCVIELGADARVPTYIRWPFEKIVYYNRKSFLYRIHASFYQLGANISERGVGIKENSISFLANGFVNYGLM